MPELDILVKPVPKARPRLGRGGHVFTPRTTELAEDRIRQAWCAGATTGAAYPWFFSPLRLLVTVRVARPAAHFGTGRNAGVVRAAAPLWPAVKPDVDNYVKTVLDALNGVAFRDDSQIVELSVRKVYARDGEAPGWRIGVYPMEDTQ